MFGENWRWSLGVFFGLMLLSLTASSSSEAALGTVADKTVNESNHVIARDQDSAPNWAYVKKCKSGYNLWRFEENSDETVAKYACFKSLGDPVCDGSRVVSQQDGWDSCMPRGASNSNTNSYIVGRTDCTRSYTPDAGSTIVIMKNAGAGNKDKCYQWRKPRKLECEASGWKVHITSEGNAVNCHPKWDHRDAHIEE